MPAKIKKPIFQATLGTAWFVALIIIAIIAAVAPGTAPKEIVYLILGICGAMIAIDNIRIDEEQSFLIAVTGLIIITISWLIAMPQMNEILKSLLINLDIGFGVAAFIVALSEIYRLGIER
ncbi:MAG: hypothetical protein QXO19_03300 [Candidatus Aenigmatarchaeota archaeon]